MPFSEFFHPECDPVEPHDAPNHVVFSCIQWKNSSLGVMPKAAKQSFAVMYGDTLDSYVSAALERAYILGAMSPVKLIAVHDVQLYFFLDSDVPSATVREIEALWAEVTYIDPTPWEVSFASVSELYSGCSDYRFWPVAKEILESHALGIEHFDLLTPDDALAYDDLWSHYLH